LIFEDDNVAIAAAGMSRGVSWVPVFGQVQSRQTAVWRMSFALTLPQRSGKPAAVELPDEKILAAC
jgi:hypothetical protein